LKKKVKKSGSLHYVGKLYEATKSLCRGAYGGGKKHPILPVLKGFKHIFVEHLYSIYAQKYMLQ
tara:strand:- start:1476 stop:1667 length:192 start_codon:yes stop_codon:yes gene_type:complete